MPGWTSRDVPDRRHGQCGPCRQWRGGAVVLGLVVVLAAAVTADDEAAATAKPPVGSEGKNAAAKIQDGQHDAVYYAINAGGSELTGHGGILYGGDLDDAMQASGGLTAHVPIPIARAQPDDLLLYQTERYGLETFSYEFATPPSGRYTLVLRFAEVAFDEAGKKVFNIVLNEKHTIVRDLDIYGRVGHGTAHDEYVPFIIKESSTLKFRRKTSKVADTIKLEFAKGQHDNPKICAFAIIKGTLADAQRLIPSNNPDPGTKSDVVEGKEVGVPGGPDDGEGGGGADGAEAKKLPRKKRADVQEEDRNPLPFWTLVLAAAVIAGITAFEWLF